MSKTISHKTVYKSLSIIITFITVSVFLFFSAHKVDPDEGIVLHTAWQIWNGSKDLYTNNFSDYLAPGSALLVYWTWKLFGHPLFAYAKLLVFVFWLLGAMGIYFIITRYTSRFFLILLSVLLWTISIGFSSQINHNPLSTAISVLALYLILLLAKSPRFAVVLSLLLGLANALVLWFLQTKGLAIFVVFFVYFIFDKNISKKILIYYSSSFIVFSLLLLSITGLKQTLVALFWLPLTLNYLSANQNQPIFIIILLALTVLSLMFFVSIHSGRKDYLIISLFQLALFLSTANNFNFSHFLINLFPAIIFYVIYFSDNYERLQPVLGKITNVLAVCSFIFILNISVRNIFGPNIFKDNILKEFDTPQIAKAKNIYAGPFLPGYYYEARKPCPYSLSHTDVISPELELTMLEQIKNTKPEIAFSNLDLVSHSLNIDPNNPIDKYTRDNYQKCPKNFKKNVEVYVLDQSFCPE